MIKHGDIPEEGMELVNEVTGRSHIEVVWGESDTIFVVGWTGTKRKNHYVYRFFKVGETWDWSVDYQQH